VVKHCGPALLALILFDSRSVNAGTLRKTYKRSSPEGEHENGHRMTVIFREGQSCFASGFAHGDFMTKATDGYVSFRTLAKSYTLSYLLKIGRTNARLK
jgi:hypothetical protein